MTPAVEAMALLLAEAGVGAYSRTEALPADAVPITVSTMPATPDAALTLTTYPGGPEPDTRSGDEYPRLQVRTRAGDPLAALELDRAAYDVLQAPRPRRLPSGWWLQDCYALQSEPAALGADGSGRHEFTRNYQLDLTPPETVKENHP